METELPLPSGESLSELAMVADLSPICPIKLADDDNELPVTSPRRWLYPVC
jgi:hypothetical protein